MAMRGLIDRAEDGERAALAQAWHTARLGRVKTFPRLSALLPKQPNASRTQTPEQFAAAFAAWGSA
jgi:hypothetical protein